MFQKNSALLSQSNPECLIELATLQPTTCEVSQAKKGGLTLSHEGSFVHSKYAPLKEAQQVFAAQKHPQHGIHLHLGFGLGYLLEVDTLPADDGVIVIYEPNADFLLTAFHHRDLTPLLTHRKVWFCCTLEGLKKQLRKAFQDFEDLFLFHLPFHKKHMPQQLREAVTLVHKELDKKRLFGVGFDQQKQRVLQATLTNLPYTWHAPGLSSVYGTLKKIPAVIVLPGPSLERNLVHLSRYKDKVAIFSVARSLSALERQGIEPHFLVHNEPQPLMPLFRTRTNLSRTVYLLAEQCHTSLHQHAKRKAYIYQNPTNKISQFLVKHFPKQGNKGMIVSAGTVATEAFITALLLGCSPVILIGQDLALTSGKYYAVSSENLAYTHSQREFRNVPGYFGGKVQTLIHYAHFLEWYRESVPVLKKKFPGVSLINASEGGAYIEGFEAMSLGEVLQRHASSAIGSIFRHFSNAPHLPKPLPVNVLDILKAKRLT